jgi:hypothetical protein
MCVFFISFLPTEAAIRCHSESLTFPCRPSGTADGTRWKLRAGHFQGSLFEACIASPVLTPCTASKNCCIPCNGLCSGSREGISQCPVSAHGMLRLKLSWIIWLHSQIPQTSACHRLYQGGLSASCAQGPSSASGLPLASSNNNNRVTTTRGHLFQQKQKQQPPLLHPNSTFVHAVRMLGGADVTSSGCVLPSAFFLKALHRISVLTIEIITHRALCWVLRRTALRREAAAGLLMESVINPTFRASQGSFIKHSSFCNVSQQQAYS